MMLENDSKEMTQDEKNDHFVKWFKVKVSC